MAHASSTSHVAAVGSPLGCHAPLQRPRSTSRMRAHFRYAEHAADVAAVTLTSAAAALALFDGGQPAVLRGLLPADSKSWLPAAALDGDEQVRLDINPLHEASAPVKLRNRTHIRPAESSVPLRHAAALLRQAPAARGYHAYVTQFPLSRGPALTAALPLSRALYLANHLVSVNFWLADGGLRTGLHYDPHDNLLVQLRGEKSILLFPPNVSEGFGLYLPYTERRYIFDAATGRISGHRAAGGAPIENHATVDVFAPSSSSSEAAGAEGGGGGDEAEAEKGAGAEVEAEALRAALRAHAHVARLHAGEALYLPALWSHAVLSHKGAVVVRAGGERVAAPSEALNAAVNLWFNPPRCGSFRAALRARPDFAAGHLSFGDALQTHGRLSEAAAAYEAALALRPSGFHDASHNLGSALHALGDLPGAERHFRAAAALRPAAPKTAVSLGACLHKQRRLDEAAAAFEAALTAPLTCDDGGHEHARAHTALGNTRALQRRLPEAAAALEAAIALAPREPKAYSSLGLVRVEEGGQRAQARAALEAALRLAPASEYYAANLAQAEAAERRERGGKGEL